MPDSGSKLAEAAAELRVEQETKFAFLENTTSLPEYYEPAAILLPASVPALHAIVFDTINKAAQSKMGTPARVEAYEKSNLLMALARDDQMIMRSPIDRLAASAWELENSLRTVSGVLDVHITNIGALP